MALYTLTLRDGSTLNVEAPEGATKEDLARAASRQQRRQSYEGTAFGDRLAAREERVSAAQEDAAAKRAAYEAMFDEPDESGFIGDLLGGFASGVVGLGEQAALGAATLLDEEEELAARERIQGLANSLRPEMGDEEDLTYKIGSTFGSIAGFIGAGAGATYGAGAAGLGAAGAGIAGLLGAGTLGVGAATGEASERARAAGATEEERNRAIRQAIPVGASEALPIRRILGKLTGDLGEEAVQGFRQRIVSALRTGGEEAAQEAAAGIAQNLIERGYNIDQAILEGAGEAAALGGGAGATIQVLVDLFAGRRAPSAPAPTEEPPLALPAPSMQVTPEGQALTEEQRREREAVLGDMPRGAVIGERGTARQPTPEELAFERGRETIATEEQRAQAAAREREALRAAQRGDEAAFEQPDLFALQQEQERRRLGPEELRRPDQFMDVEEAAEVVTPEQPAAMGDLVEMADQRQRAAQEDADIADQLAAIEAEEGAQRQQAAALRAESDLETITGQQETQRQQATEQGRRRILQDVIEKTPSRNYNRVSRVYEDALARAGYRGEKAKPTEAELQTIQRAVNVQRAERPTGVQVSGVNEAIADGVGAISVTDNGAPVPFKNFALSVEGDRAEVGMVERDRGRTRPGVGLDAYIALGKELAARGITLQSSATLQADGLKLWKRLAEQGFARRNPRTKQYEFVVSERPSPIQAPPEATQLQEMEARIPEATPREPEQLGMPGIRRRVQQAPAQPTPETPAPNVVTDEMLDQMGISAKSPIRQRVRGKDLNDPATRKILSSFATQPRTSQAAELGISRALEGVPAEQPDLFIPRRGGRPAAQPTPATAPTPTPTPAPSRAAAAPAEQLQPAPETQEAPDVTAPVTRRTGTGVPSRRERMAGVRRPVGGGARPGASAASKRGRLGVRDEVTPRPTPAARTERAPLEAPTRRRAVLPTLDVTKPRTGALAPKPRPKAPTTTRTGESKASVEAKLLDAYDANTSADHKRFVKSMAVEPAADPMTITDKEAVLKLVNTKSNKELKNTIGAVKKYLGAYEDPILGLQDAIDDVVSEAPNFRKAEGMTATEVAFFGPDNANYLPARGKNSAQATLDWAAENMSEQTKKWIATAIRDAKQLNTNVEAFQSTDLVAKRRELETLFEGGFDATTEADAKALEALMEKLGIDETDPMLRSMMYKGGLFNMASPASTAPLPNVVTRLLKGGNLQGALRALAANTSDPDVRAVAEKLAKNVGDTKVKLVKSIDAMAGVAGRFTEADNTIQLAEFAGFEPGTDTKIDGLNVHTLLHEMTHAATVATLGKKGHPLARKLQKIFDETKDYAPTAYGFTNLNEFVAEAFTNPEFQRVLSGLRIEGDPLTPFAKIKAAISNFLRTLIGKPVKPVESALEQATSIIDNILAPHPDKIGTGEFYMLSPAGAGKRTADFLKGVVDKTPAPTKEFVQQNSDQVLDFIKSDAKDTAKKFLMYSLPMIGVVNAARAAGIKGAKGLLDLVESQRGAINKSDQQVEAVLKTAKTWVRNNPDKVDALNRVVYTSTIEQVDPTKPVSAYANDPDKLKAWKAMRNDWRSLSASGGDKLYAQMRDSYKKQYEKMRDVIYGRLDETSELSPESRNTLKQQVYARLFEGGNIEPYFPLTRVGSHWLSYNAGGEFVVEAFETKEARKRAMMELQKDNNVTKIEPFVNISNVKYANAPEGSFVKETLKVLDANKVNPEVKEEIMRLFIETLPETSFAKSLQRRKNTPGYKEDAIGAFSTKAFDLGRQVERLKYSAKIMDWEKQFLEDNDAAMRSDDEYLINELMQRANFARNPPKDALAQNLNRGAFMFTLGFNVSSALVNTSQVPMVVFPMLGGKHGFGATGRAIRDASKLFASSGFSRKSDMLSPYGDEKNVKVQAMPGIDNYFELDANGDYVIRKDIELDEDMRAQVEEIKPLMQMMSERGHLNRSLIADTLGIDNSGRKRSAVDYVSSLGAFFFHNAEVFNRQVTSMAAYKLELERLKEAEPTLSTAERQQRAAEQALYDSQMMNGGAVLETAPRISQQGIGRVALMYKTYGIQMYYTLLKTARDGIDAHFAGDKEARNVALRQLGGVVGSTFVLAGVVGLPFAREIMQLIDFLFFDEEEEDVETVVRKAIGEGFYKGPLTELLGVDLSSRIGLSGLILQANRFNSDPSPEESLLYYAGGPAWSTISSMLRGIEDMKQGEIQRGFEAMVPSGFRNLSQVTRYLNDGAIVTRRGDPIMDDLSFGELAAKAIGFAPAEYTRTQEMNQQTKGIDRAVNAKRTRLLRQYYVATRMGDYDERNRVMARIRAFNNRHRTARIDPDSIRRSMRQHMETSATMYNGITISPNMRRVLEESRNDWDQGFQLF